MVLAGATDFYPARIDRPIEEDIVDISRIAELRGIEHDEDGWRLGALTTWREIAEQPLPALFDGLKAAAGEVGGMQIQNRGTIGGNLCNASPAADGIPPLLALDASVELASSTGTRSLPLAAFILGNRITARRPDELLTAVRIPARRARTRSAFLKLGARRYLVISIAMVAATVETDGAGRIARAGLAVGACGPVAQRLRSLESRLLDQPIAALSDFEVLESDLVPLSPRTDVRATAAYRHDAVVTLLQRALRSLGDA